MVVAVKVIPRSVKSEVVGLMADGTLKVKVAAVPEDGKANEELCRILAVHFGMSRAQVEVIAGKTGTRKQVRVGSD